MWRGPYWGPLVGHNAPHPAVATERSQGTIPWRQVASKGTSSCCMQLMAMPPVRVRAPFNSVQHHQQWRCFVIWKPWSKPCIQTTLARYFGEFLVSKWMCLLWQLSNFSSLFSFGLHKKIPRVYSNIAKYAKSIPISGSVSDKSDCRFDRSIMIATIISKQNPCNKCRSTHWIPRRYILVASWNSSHPRACSTHRGEEQCIHNFGGKARRERDH
jgi:hypothetical protein